MKDIGKNIQTLRQEKHMTQEELAEVLYVTRQTVSNYENGRSRPDLDMLLKIAEILETDVTALIYGPPVPQRKKDSYKWLLISGSIFAVIAALYVWLTVLFPRQSVFGYMYSARIAVQLAGIPTVMFVLGWVLVHFLSVFSGLQQLCHAKFKALRIIALIMLGVLVAIPLPIIIFSAIAGYRSYMYHSVSMTFPHIPVYLDAFYAILFVIEHIPFVYTILGGVFWLLGLPRIKKEPNEKSEETL